jgi:hypothetical protein
MRRLLVVAFTLTVGSLVPSVAPASTPEQLVDRLEGQCSMHVKDLQRTADIWRWVGIGVAAIAGIVAGASGLKAGLSDQVKGRKWGIVALVSGAITAISPLLPKAEDFTNRATLADRHHIMGLKVRLQLDMLDPTRPLRARGVQYVVARFTDCLAEYPAAEIPDLPTERQTEVVVGAPGNQPEQLTKSIRSRK